MVSDLLQWYSSPALCNFLFLFRTQLLKLSTADYAQDGSAVFSFLLHVQMILRWANVWTPPTGHSHLKNSSPSFRKTAVATLARKKLGRSTQAQYICWQCKLLRSLIFTLRLLCMCVSWCLSTIPIKMGQLSWKSLSLTTMYRRKGLTKNVCLS